MRNRTLFLVGSLVALVLLSTSASAATFADMFKTFESTIDALKSLLKVAFPVGGFFCVGFGLFKFIQNNPQDSMFDKLIWVLVGGCLLGIAAFAAMSSESMGLSTSF